MATSLSHPSLLPVDVRLMNQLANTVFALVGAALVVAGLLWAMRQPVFAFRAIRLEGELTRNNVGTLRANAVPHLAGNFFTMDLNRARAAFEGVPWVRRATVRRVWPDTLAVRIEEHHAAAIWHAADGDEQLVDADGSVFDANVGDVEDDGLPTLGGPDGSAPHVLAMHQRLAPLFAKLDDGLQTLTLSARGSWHAEFDSGLAMELGRGDDAEVQARAARFVRTVGQVAARFPGHALETADLRHADGYAVKLEGVTTNTDPQAAQHPGAARTQTPSRKH